MKNAKQKLENSDWYPYLKKQFEQPYYKKIREFLKKAYDVKKTDSGGFKWSKQRVFPDASNIFNAYILTPFKQTKVVILGQDPYPTPGNAMGLSFSVMPDKRVPASLQNIYKEMHNDIGTTTPQHGCLLPWTKQGIMLLNSVLTIGNEYVFGRKNNSHQGIGWEHLTDYTIKILSDKKQPVVFILWGNKAKAKEKLIDKESNVVIKSPHPSPLSARYGFFGSRPFSKTNYALKKIGLKPVNWQLPQQFTIADVQKYFDAK